MARIISPGADYTPYPTVQPGEPSGQLERVEANPAEFGGLIGAAEQKAGGQLEETGNRLFEAAQYIGQIYSEGVANQKYSQLQDKINTLLGGDPNNPNDRGLYGLTGQAAMDARPKVWQQITAYQNELAAQLPNTISQNRFNNDTRRLMASTLFQINEHTNQQTKAWALSTAEAADDSNVRSAFNNWSNDDNLNNLAADQRTVVAKSKSSVTGYNPDYYAPGMESKVWVAGIEGALANNNWQRADQILQSHRDNIDPLKAQEYELKIQSHKTVAGGLDLFNWASAPDGTPMPGTGNAPGTTGQPRILGQSPGSTGWGPMADPAIKTMKDKGASDAFIQAAMAAGLGEGGFKQNWGQSWVNDNGQREESFGHWQLHRGGELDTYEQQYGTDHSTESQAKYLVDRMEQLHPGITKTTDPRAALDAINTQFEKYRGAAPGQRGGLLMSAQASMGAPLTGEPTQPGQVPTKFDFSWGDSVAHGAGTHAGFDETNFGNDTDANKNNTKLWAVDGRTPAQVLAATQAQVADLTKGNPDALKSKLIVFSSGASNDHSPQAMALIPQQLKTMISAGARPVLLGVGAGVGNSAQVNAQLKQYADQAGIPFTGELKGTQALNGQPARVHPRNYDDTIQQALQAAAQRSVQITPTNFDTQHAEGMTAPGNLDPWHRPVLRNPDGTYSTTSSISIGTDKGEVLIPTVVDGKRLSNDDAIKHFHDTGENLGTFDTADHANAYATALHNAQASMYDANGNPKQPAPADQLVNQTTQPPSATKINTKSIGNNIQQMPDGVPAKDLVAIAQQQEALAAEDARRVANIDKWMAAGGDPLQAKNALDFEEHWLRAHNNILNAEAKLLQEKNNQLVSDFSSEIIIAKGNYKPDLIDRISDPNNSLTKDQKDSLVKFMDDQAGDDLQSNTKKFGTGAWGAYNRITADESDPNKIRYPIQIVQLANTKDENGRPVLTSAAVDYLMGRLDQQQKALGGISYEDQEKTMQKYAVAKMLGSNMSEDQMSPEQLSRIGGFMSVFHDYVQDGMKNGEPMTKILSKENIDNLISSSGYDKTDAEKMLDLQNSIVKWAGNWTQKLYPAGTVPPRLPNETMEQYDARIRGAAPAPTPMPPMLQ